MARRVQKSAKMQEVEQTVLTHDRTFIRPINPLLVEEILEHVLSFLKDDNKSKSLGRYRIVCKFWEREIIKQIRRETSVKLYTILTPYPEGFGWTAGKNGNTFHYKVPYQQVRPFENVEVVFNHRWLKKANYIQLETWFKLMGNQIKSLIYTCSLQTYQKKHCTTLERILKEWCPNLERLSINKRDNGCLFGLIFTSLFENPTKEFICKKLAELNVNMHLQNFNWPRPHETPKILVNPDIFNRFIYNHGQPFENHTFPEISNLAGIKVTVPEELLTKKDLPNFSEYFPENFFPEYLDGGILGQLMKNTNIRKFTLGGRMDSSCRKQLMAFFYYRKNNWKTSLTNLEINWFSGMANFTKDLVLFGKLNFPITTLKLNTERHVFETTNADLTRYLSCFSETLEHLDVNVDQYRETSVLKLPLLPKLKTFVINRINICSLSAANIIQNAPNLEKCYLTQYGEETRFDDIWSLDKFFEENSLFSNERLKDLRLNGNYCRFSGKQASKLLDWFPKVRRLELTGMLDDNSGILGFLQKLGNSEVTKLKISWCKEGEEAETVDDTAVIQATGKLQNLICLEMNYDDDDEPIHVQPIALLNGIGKLKNLRFLKLTNIMFQSLTKQRL